MQRHKHDVKAVRFCPVNQEQESISKKIAMERDLMLFCERK